MKIKDAEKFLKHFEKHLEESGLKKYGAKIGCPQCHLNIDQILGREKIGPQRKFLISTTSFKSKFKEEKYDAIINQWPLGYGRLIYKYLHKKEMEFNWTMILFGINLYIKYLAKSLNDIVIDQSGKTSKSLKSAYDKINEALKYFYAKEFNEKD